MWWRYCVWYYWWTIPLFLWTVSFVWRPWIWDREPRLLIWSPVLVDFIPLLKFQDSTLLTPPRASKLGDDIDWLVNAKLESPPIINKPLGKDDNNKLHRYANICHGLSYQQWSRSNLFTFTQEIYRVNVFRQAGWNHPQSCRGGPTQHLGPGQTIYNVASKSTLPYQPYTWQPASHSATWYQSLMASQGEGMIETSWVFNLTWANLCGQSRRGICETTITGYCSYYW